MLLSLFFSSAIRLSGVRLWSRLGRGEDGRIASAPEVHGTHERGQHQDARRGTGLELLLYGPGVGADSGQAAARGVGGECWQQDFFLFMNLPCAVRLESDKS